MTSTHPTATHPTASLFDAPHPALAPAPAETGPTLLSEDDIAAVAGGLPPGAVAGMLGLAFGVAYWLSRIT